MLMNGRAMQSMAIVSILVMAVAVVGIIVFLSGVLSKGRYVPAADEPRHSSQAPVPSAGRAPEARDSGQDGNELDRILAGGDRALAKKETKEATAHDSKVFIDRKSEFWSKATDEQKARGKDLLAKLRKALEFPDNVIISANVTSQGGRKSGYSSKISFKFPEFYREDAQGDLSYTYVTDGVHEITDFLSAQRQCLPSVVGHDVDANVYFDMFPVRLVTDSELAWTGQKTVTSVDGSPLAVSVLSTWSYDMLLRDSDSLVEEMVFYDRLTRQQPLIRIGNIQYNVHTMHSTATDIARQGVLPVSYVVTYTNGKRSSAYDVALSYNTEQPLSDTRFALALGK
jgi:hypothetical protein